MMVNSISGVRFCAQADAAATGTKKVDADYLNRPGAFTKPEADTVETTQAQPKKKSSFGKKLLVLAGVALAVGAALVAGNKTGLVKVLTDAEKEGAGIMQKASHYLAKAGEWVGKYTYEPIANLFKRA